MKSKRDIITEKIIRLISEGEQEQAEVLIKKLLDKPFEEITRVLITLGFKLRESQEKKDGN